MNSAFQEKIIENLSANLPGRRNAPPPGALGRLLLFVFIGVIVLMAAFGSFYTVDQGDRAVQLRNGRIVGVSDPGLHLKLPFIDNVVEISTRQHSFTPTNVIEAYSYDQQVAKLKISVTYHIPASEVGVLYSQYGSIEAMQARTLEKRTFDVVKTVFGQYTAASAIQDRAKLDADENLALRNALKDVPVAIENVQVEDVSFSNAYDASIENRMQAEVAIQTERQKAETAKVQAQIKVTQATAEADAQRAMYQAKADGTLLQAKAEANAIELKGQAEAKAIKARADALASNTNLISLNAVDRWNGQLPSSMIPGSAVPFINLKPAQ